MASESLILSYRFDVSTRCTTCRQPQLHCTCHFGHMDLVLPYITILWYSRSSWRFWSVQICVICHHFKMHKERVRILGLDFIFWDLGFLVYSFKDMCLLQVRLFATKLELIALGRMVEAARVQLPSKDAEEGPGENLSDDDDVERILNKASLTKSGNARTQWTSAQLAAARAVILRFKDDMPKARCENCLASYKTFRSGKNISGDFTVK